MKITRIEINGFKSYANRVAITGFDPQFNAITGLNGSGKSNILDAICFVLGISNLSHVRAVNMSDLVYKQGQTGVSQASVTITFEVDKNLPIDGRTSFVVRRQVSVNGTSNYLLNGRSATNTRVVDFFRSVGLNINNPHFLIMQGRVTKVLNMKPPEILGMIEEAAGTRLYDDKVAKAQATIKTKDSKMEEIVKIIRDDLEPKLERLEQEKENYTEYQKIVNHIEIDEKSLRRAEYVMSTKQRSHFVKQANRMDSEISNFDCRIEQVNDSIESVAAAHQNLELQRAQTNVGDLRDLQDRVEETNRYFASLKSEINSNKKTIESNQLSIDRMAEDIEADRRDIDTKKVELAQKENEFGGRETQGIEAEKAVERAREKLTALAQGMTTNDRGETTTVDAELTEAKSELSVAQTIVQTKRMRLKQLRPGLESKTTELNRLGATQQGRLAEIDEANRKVVVSKMEVDSISFDRERFHELRHRQEELTRSCGQLDSNIDRQRNEHKFTVKYVTPRNFDERKVRGTVISLIRLKDPKYAKAMETIAKASLGDLVVDDAETAKALLTYGRLTSRIRILPLNKLCPHYASERALSTAQNRYGRHNVILAKDLLDYDREFEAAIAYIFGSVVVCSDMSIAKKVPFELGLHCVTLDGDYVNPSGVLSGGASGSSQSRLAAYDNYLKCVREREDKINELNCIRGEIAEHCKNEAGFERAHRNYEQSKKRLEQLQAKMAVGTVAMLTKEINAYEEEIRSSEQEITAAQHQISELTAKVNKLEHYKSNEKECRGKEKKQAQEELKRAEQLLRSVKGGSDRSKEILNVLRAEISSLQNDIDLAISEMETKQIELRKCREDVKKLESSLNDAERSCAEAKTNRDNAKSKAREVENALRSHIEEMNKLKKRHSELLSQRKEADLERAEYVKTAQSLLRKIERMEKEHCGIKEARAEDVDFETAKRALEKKEARLAELQRIVNPKVMDQLSGAAQRLSVLQKKLETLNTEKKTLLTTIGTLNVKKETVILKAHKQINQDFGGIFGSLLPGAMAALQPPKDAKDAMGGLEVKVGFNGKWKDSLQELSGGQRSLVALSLILAMLKYNPAPLYILDEVDAALDISHTRNIGRMIRDHFTESQFIVVSLKDNLFNYANVLYRTKFVNGSSTVMRTTSQDPVQEEEP